MAGLVGLTPENALRATRGDTRVAVIGAGAAGLSCAHDLVLLGHRCMVFDAADEPGGLLTSALPAFRFPVASARAECAAILAMGGLELQSRYRIENSADVRALLAGEFDAVFLALGASHPRFAMFAAQPDHPQVVDAITVLGTDAPFEGTIVVVGDGDLALDAARTIVRRAARDDRALPRLQLVLERAIEDSDVPPGFIAAAVAEGIVVHGGWTAGRWLADESGMLSGIEIVRPTDRSAKVLSCDTIVTAGARAPHAQRFAPDIALDGDGLIVVDPVTLETSMHGVWAGGACAFGHRSVAHATAEGKRAAWSIHGALTGRPVRLTVASAWVEAGDWDESRAETALATPPLDATGHAPPSADPFSASAARPDADIRREASRCFDCTVVPVVDEHCTSCGKCVSACPEGAFQMHAGPPKQLNLDPDLCTRCGLCVEKCPEGAIALLRAVWDQRLTQAPVSAPAAAPAPEPDLDPWVDPRRPTVQRPTPVG
ncbi:MAG TPA: FAD-dependent oxidoreductase [Gemmatimonadaceae bacterium]|nr:FAD-dependent oxidoreductase [Gemmatimonadaceae bacterium]